MGKKRANQPGYVKTIGKDGRTVWSPANQSKTAKTLAAELKAAQAQIVELQNQLDEQTSITLDDLNRKVSTSEFFSEKELDYAVKNPETVFQMSGIARKLLWQSDFTESQAVELFKNIEKTEDKYWTYQNAQTIIFRRYGINETIVDLAKDSKFSRLQFMAAEKMEDIERLKDMLQDRTFKQHHFDIHKAIRKVNMSHLEGYSDDYLLHHPQWSGKELAYFASTRDAKTIKDLLEANQITPPLTSLDVYCITQDYDIDHEIRELFMDNPLEADYGCPNSRWSVNQLINFDDPHPFQNVETVQFEEVETELPEGTWRDLRVAIDKLMSTSEDKHHIFIENFQVKNEKLIVWCGS